MRENGQARPWTGFQKTQHQLIDQSRFARPAGAGNANGDRPAPFRRCAANVSPFIAITCFGSRQHSGDSPVRIGNGFTSRAPACATISTVGDLYEFDDLRQRRAGEENAVHSILLHDRGIGFGNGSAATAKHAPQ